MDEEALIEMCDHEGMVQSLDRGVVISGPITEDVAAQVLNFLTQLDQVDGQITIKLMSPGGDVVAGWAIYDAIRMCRNQVRIEGYGEVCSIATLIFMAGDERLMSPECRWMVHEGSVDFGGNIEVSVLRARVQEFEFLNNSYNRVMAERSGQSIKTFRRLTEKETYLDAKSCVKSGFAHGILRYPKRKKKS
jgi:ATP-dependent Clp protease, protease subunit